MNASNIITEVPNKPSASTPTRPLYWSVRRELWENKSIYIGPLIAAAVIVFGFLVSIGHFPQRRRAALLLDESVRHAAIQLPYSIAAMVILMTGIIVGIFYCLDALYGERRDRSILFWKSLPVSDLTSVLAKASVALIVLPLVSFFIIVATQLFMLIAGSIVLSMNGLSASMTWQHFPMLRQSVFLLYGLVVLALWHAPTYGWCLLVSSWARRATFLWAILPFAVISIFEWVTFNTSHFYSFVKNRLFSFGAEAFDFSAASVQIQHGQHIPTLDSFSQLTPGRYLTSPGLWLGLIFAATCVAVAVRFRRSQGPI